MAKIIKSGRNLERELLHCRDCIRAKYALSILFFCIGIISGLLSYYTYQTILLIITFVFCVLAICMIWSASPLKTEMDIIKSGIDGENMANGCIALLPDSYTAFRNITITFKNKSSEIDILIVGPTGVFVVETKNLNGGIYGDINDTYWRLCKVGRGGTPYSKVFYSPLKQVNTHVYRVANYLRQNGIRTHVNAAVYFPNVNSDIVDFESDEKTRLFFARYDGADRMLRYILNNDQQISQGVCTKIILLLKKHSEI